MALFLTEKDVKKLLTMDIALEAVEEGFRQQSEGEATNSPRFRLRLPNGDLNLMAAVSPGFGVMGMKTYGVTSGNLTKFYMQLWSIESGELMASMEASTLGQIRTGAASGVATKYMSRQESNSVDQRAHPALLQKRNFYWQRRSKGLHYLLVSLRTSRVLGILNHSEP